MLASLTIVFIFGIITILLSKQILNLAINNKIGFTMLLIFLMLIGFLFMQKLKVELRPDISYQTVSIYISVRGGMSVVDIERLIIKPVEESMIQVSKVKNIISRSKPNEAVVSLEFESDTNMDMAALEVREYFMRVKNKLPKEIEKPVIARYNENDSYVMNVSFTSKRKTTEQLRYLVDKNIKDKIMRIEGVANVLVSGGRERKFLIDLDEKKLIAHNISINDVLQIIGRNNINILTGKLEDKTKFYALRVDGSFLSLDDIKNLSIKLDEKTGIVKLSEVADIKDSFLEAEAYARLNEQEAVSIYVYKESSANTMEVTQKVEAALNKLVAEAGNQDSSLAKDIKITYMLNQGKLIESSINSIKETIFYGILLVILILAIVFASHFFAKILALSAFILYFTSIFGVYYFGVSQNFVLIFIAIIIIFFTFCSFIYKDYRPSVFIAITIPISLLITMMLMYIGKISLNVMSMSGLLLGVGLLVDNSIVVVASYVSHRANPLLQDLTNKKIIKISTQKMIEPIVGGTLTAVIVFLSFFFLDQKTQMLYKDIAFTVSSALFASFFCAIGVIPMLLCFYNNDALTRRENETNKTNIFHKTHAFFTKEVSSANQFMQKFKNFVKNHRIIIVDILAIVAVLLFLSLMFFKKYSMDKTLFLIAVSVFFVTIFFGIFFYKDYMKYLFTKKWILFGVILTLFFSSIYEFAYKIPKDFIPSEEQNQFTVFVELSSGVKLDIANKIAKETEQKINDEKELKGMIENISSKIEGWSIKIFVTLYPKNKRKLTTEQAINVLRKKLTDVGREYDGFVYFSQPYEGKEIFVDIYGNNYKTLDFIASNLYKKLSSNKNFIETKIRNKPGRPNIILSISQPKIASMGLDLNYISKTLHAKVRGLKATNFKAKDDRIETIVRVNPNAVKNIEDLKQLTIMTKLPSQNSQNQFVIFPLEHIANLVFDIDPSQIWRKNKERFIQVSSSLSNISLSEAGKVVNEIIRTEKVPEGYYMEISGDYTDMIKSQKSFKFAIIITCFFVFAVMASIFESLVSPFIIMFNVLCSVIGTVYTLSITGTVITSGVLIGLLMVGGIIVNNGIIMISEINRNRLLNPCKNLRDLIIDSSYDRLKPIFTTIFTAICGLVPMLIDNTSSSVLWKPFAITVAGGLFIGSFWTIVLTPILYDFYLTKKTGRLKKQD